MFVINNANDLYSDFMYNKFGVSKKIIEIGIKAQNDLLDVFNGIDAICEYNQIKVLHAMQKNNLNDACFSFSSGYGYNDIGRDVTEKIYTDIFNTQDSLVRVQFVSGTHALSCALFANLKPGDELIYASGEPYDTLKKVIGIKKTPGSLVEKGVVYKQIDLDKDQKFNYPKIKSLITPRTKVIGIQRSRGYSLRDSISTKKIGDLINFIKDINRDIICLVDNCYGEFVETSEPSDFGADLIVGSLIKNPGGGLARTGAYISGRSDLIKNCSQYLIAPGLGKEIGASLGESFCILQGLFLASQTVSCALKTAVFAAKVFSMLGFEVFPKPEDHRTDIVQAINLGSRENLIKFCDGVQKASPVNHFFRPIPEKMPGYDCEVIMAAGNFIQGASIEFSADAPLREPYTVFLQGALTWPHGKNALLIALDYLLNK